MSSKWPSSGPNNVPAYQLSAIPFVTTSADFEVPSPDTNGASSEPIRVKFPYVTRFFTINNTGAHALRVAFTYSGSFAPGEYYPNGEEKGSRSWHDYRNYFLIPSASGTTGWSGVNVVSFEARCKELYFMSDFSASSPNIHTATSFSLFAGLTSIPASQFPRLTGSLNGSTAFQGVG